MTEAGMAGVALEPPPPPGVLWPESRRALELTQATGAHKPTEAAMCLMHKLPSHTHKQLMHTNQLHAHTPCLVRPWPDLGGCAAGDVQPEPAD